MAETTSVQPVEQQGEHLSLPWFCQDTHDAACGSPCTPSGCHNTHSSGRYVLDGPAWDEDYLQMGIPAMSKAHAEFIVRAVNSHHALVSALKECSFRLAALTVASGYFSENNARALDMASAALAHVDGHAHSDRTEV